MLRGRWVTICALPVFFGLSEPALAEAPAESDAQSLLDEATTAFQSGDFALAHERYASALPMVKDVETRSVLLFSLGASSYELGEFRRAETEFLRVAESSEGLRDRALCHAGFSALELGSPERALGYLQQVGESEAAAHDKETLRQALERFGQERQLQRFVEQYEQGRRALRQGQLRKARKLLNQARSHGIHAAPTDQAMVLLALAQLERLEQNWAQADALFRRALRMRLSERDAADVRVAQRELRRLPKSGPFSEGALGLGFDSAAQQSGSTSYVGFSPSLENTNSAVAIARLEMGYRWARGRASTWGASYRGNWLGLLAEKVRDASFQTHGGTLEWFFAPGSQHRLAGSAGVTTSLIGFTAPSPFTVEPHLSVQWSFRHARNWVADVDVQYRHYVGLTERAWLTGPSLQLRVSDSVSRGPYRLGGWLGVHYLGMGTRTVGFPKGELFHCAPPADEQLRCANRLRNQEGTYTIPLGYVSPHAGIELDYAVTRSLSVGFFAQASYRRYLADSFAEPDVPDDDLPPEATRKLREDWLPKVGARGTWSLSSGSGLAIYIDYSLLLSRSNMAREEPYASPPQRDPDQNFDYDNRNFDQHVGEAGLSFEF